MRLALGKFTCSGIEASLGSDVVAGVCAAIADYMRRLDAGVAPTRIPEFARDSRPEPARSFDLPLDADAVAVLEREAARQGATASQLARHSVLLYLAEVDRLTPPLSAV